jgi:hypothetical protein
MAMIRAALEPIVATQNVIASIPEKFDLDTATGIQLDIVGEWIGRSRYIATPITGIYFEWSGTVATGWRSGVWRGKFDPSSGLVALPDEFYRLVLKAKVVANSWNGSIPSAYDAWSIVFQNNQILIQDNQDMSMVIGVTGEPLDPLLTALLQGGYIPLKPEGVKIDYYAIAPSGGKIMSWDTDNEFLGGWDEAEWAEEIIPT